MADGTPAELALEGEYDVEVAIEEDGHWEALSKQPLSFHDALAELIDNSISAAIPKEKDYFSTKPSTGFRIEVFIERLDQDRILLTVGDEGKGMPIKQMATQLLKSGCRKGSDGILNEHGFGLKNALCVLTRNDQESSFTILSKPKDQVMVGRIDGPFSLGMKVKPAKVEGDWLRGTSTLTQTQVGTRVTAFSTMKQLRELYPKAQHLDPLMKVLREELGVTYRWFLNHSSKNHIQLVWKDDVAGASGEAPVLPIFPEFEAGTDADGTPWFQEDKITVPKGDGSSVEITYRRGIVSMAATRAKFEGDEFAGLAVEGSGPPLRKNYRGNQSTQGVDLVLRGRTLNRHVLEDLWSSGDSDDEYDPLQRHNRFNLFAGEIFIPGDVQTVNNKVSLNTHHPFWANLRDALSKAEFRPRAWGGQEQEESLKVQLKKRLETEAGVQKVVKEAGVMGVNIDLVQYHESGVQYVYEVKRGQATPLDIYQCVMYWDAFSKTDGKSLKCVTLVAKGISPNADEFREYWRTRTDEQGKAYDIRFKPLSDYGL